MQTATIQQAFLGILQCTWQLLQKSGKHTVEPLYNGHLGLNFLLVIPFER